MKDNRVGKEAWSPYPFPFLSIIQYHRFLGAYAISFYAGTFATDGLQKKGLPKGSPKSVFWLEISCPVRFRIGDFVHQTTIFRHLEQMAYSHLL